MTDILKAGRWLVPGWLGALAALAMNNDDVFKLLKAEMDEQTVALAVEGAQAAEFDISPDALVELKNKGAWG